MLKISGYISADVALYRAKSDCHTLRIQCKRPGKDMDLCDLIFIFAILAPFAQSKFVLKPVSNITIPFMYAIVDTDEEEGVYGIDKGSTEQSAYDVETGLVYVAGKGNFFHPDPVEVSRYSERRSESCPIWTMFTSLTGLWDTLRQ